MPDSLWHALAAVGAGLLAGSANAVAGGGTALSFPVLLWLGLPAVTANATNALGLWPGSVAASLSYRQELMDARQRWYSLLIVAAIGGGIGAWLLIRMPPSWFESAAPFLVLAAAAAVALEPVVSKRLEPRGRGVVTIPWATSATLTILVIATYGGYFGAGQGILLIIAFNQLGSPSLHRSNGLKNLYATTAKAVAVIYFIALGRPVWGYAGLMAIGSMSGGWVAGRAIQRVDAGRARWVVVAVGVAMGLVMLARL